MATLDALKKALREKASETTSPTRPLSDAEYSIGFEFFEQDLGRLNYRDFVIPQLSKVLDPVFASRTNISVLEIGPGPKSVLGYLPSQMRRKITRYVAFEPNHLFAAKLAKWLCPVSEEERRFLGLKSPLDIHGTPFVLDDSTGNGKGPEASGSLGKFDIILFCHSMYGMSPKHKFIEQAIDMLVGPPNEGKVVVFHRDSLHVDGLVSNVTASFPTGVVRIVDDDEALDRFTAFIAGFVTENADDDKALRLEWRKICRSLGLQEEANPGHLLFSSSDVMMVFTQHATALQELTKEVPSVSEDKLVKNREARQHHPALSLMPKNIEHVQKCVQWARKHGVGLTVVSGGHSGHCLWPNVVSVHMDAFDKIQVLTTGEGNAETFDAEPLVVVEAGCKTGDIIRETMAADLTVPLGSRPSVGAGLWLQGGIGHLARQDGLACDAIIGVVMVSVDSGQVLCVGCVPRQHQPAGAIRPENETDLLWAIKGAGTNFGIVVRVIFKAVPAANYLIRNWFAPLRDEAEAQVKIYDFYNSVANILPRDCSTDAYLYWDAGKLHLGVAMISNSLRNLPISPKARWITGYDRPGIALKYVGEIIGRECKTYTADGVGLFVADMYMSGMHGGHAGGKTSSFKRCLFLQNIGAEYISGMLISAIQTRPSPLCYLHLLHGGGAVRDVEDDATAFGCRNWEFACIITGVWPRDQDGTEMARSCVEWVYRVVKQLLPLSCGAYGADLGPDPRDAELATQAFGPNRSRLARLKQKMDPRNVLAYACPLPKLPVEQKLVLLVTGESCSGKDYSADVWAHVFNTYPRESLRARVVSISDATKRAYAATYGADLERLLRDRAYKEQHRPALTTFFQDQVRQRPQLPKEHFFSVLYAAADVDVLLVTGMRDKAPVATFAHLVPDRRLLEIRVEASREAQRLRRGYYDSGNDSKDNNGGEPSPAAKDSCPSFIFNNDVTGSEAAETFAEDHLLPFFHDDLSRLASMVRQVTDFPRAGIEFRHVLGISQQPGGLALVTSLLRSHFAGDWSKIGAIVCCEVGGLVYAPPLALQLDVPLVLIREAGKLPPPTVSVDKMPSYISSSGSNGSSVKIEMQQSVISKDASVVVVDDVLATGQTLCALLRLLVKAGIKTENVAIMVLAEFPAHKGRELLRQHGFGGVSVQSLLIFGGA